MGMVEFKMKINAQQRLAYVPKVIFAILGIRIRAVPNRAAVLLYPENMPIEQVIRSAKIILEDLQHSVDLSFEVPQEKRQTGS
jgi:hypothetical protein